MAGFQGHHSPQYLEGSGAVEVPGVISNDDPGTKSRKSPIFQVHNFFLQVLILPIFISITLLQGDIPSLLQNNSLFLLRIMQIPP